MEKICIFLCCLGLSLMLACNKSHDPEIVFTIEQDALLKKSFALIDQRKGDSALFFLKQAGEIKGNVSNQAKIRNAKGGIYYRSFMYPDALREHLDAVELFKEISDSANIARAQINTSLCFKKMGMYSKASEYLKNALIFFNQKPDYDLEVLSANMLLGNIYKEIENYPLAIEYHRKSLAIQMKESSMSVASSINNIGTCFFHQRIYDSSINYYTQYLKLGRILQDKQKIGRAHQNLAKVYLELSKRKSAREHLDSANSHYTLINYVPGLLSQYIIEANFYLGVNDSVAVHYINKGLALSKSLNKVRQTMKLLEIKQAALFNQRQFAKAYNALMSKSQLKDSLDNQAQLAKIYSYELMHRLSQKDSEIRSEKQKQKYERNLRYAVTTLALVISILAWVVYRRYLNNIRFVKEYFSSDTGVILKSGKKVEFNEILRVETLRNDLIIIKVNGERITEKNTTLKSFIPSLPKIQFGRPQRGIIINFKQVTKIWKTKIKLFGKDINISSTYKYQFLEDLNRFQNITQDQSNA